MKSTSIKKAFVPLLLAFSSWAHARTVFNGKVIKRTEELSSDYDYIVVGGGTSGLVVANRLTEDPTKTVLIIEAGILIPPTAEDQTLVPGFIGSTASIYDWGVIAEPDAELNNRISTVASAKVVGGGTVLNGMFFDRGAPADYDAWESLDNPGWGWDDLLPYFKKSETFTPPPPAQAAEFDISHIPAAHGTTGPVKASYPPFIYPHIKSFIQALKNVGVPWSIDQAANAIGVFMVPNSINPTTVTRSYAANEYYAPVSTRTNLHLITEKRVTKLLSSLTATGKLKITGVEFAETSEGPRTIVTSKRVVLAAGAVHTPQILQLSGIGNPTTLTAHGITTKLDLPGVGENLQDHPNVYINYAATFDPDPSERYMNATFDAEMLSLYRTTKTGPYTVSSGNWASFVPLDIISPRAISLTTSALVQTAGAYLRPGLPPTIISGYAAQKDVLLCHYLSSDSATSEILLSIAALAKPLSRGYITLHSADPFAHPKVDYRTVSNPVDMEVLVDSIKFLRTAMSNPAMASHSPVEPAPWSSAITDAQIKERIRAETGASMGHPSCSCSMLKKEWGGCVDPGLKVHDTTNLWIVDASVFPLIPATHLQATVYAVAEKAADLIKAASW